jgi:hypothetical protein
MEGLDTSSPDFQRAASRLDELIYLLRASQEIPPSIKQLVPYLSAGRQILSARVFEPDLWDKLLVQPLKEIIAEAPAANLGKIARLFLDWLNDALDR